MYPTSNQSYINFVEKKIALVNKIFMYPLLLLALIYNDCVYGQDTTSSNTDFRILETYGVDYVNRMELESPNRLTYLTYFLEHCYFIMDYPKGKPYEDINSVTDKNGVVSNLIIDVNNLSTFNVLNYNFKREQKIRTFYKIGNTGKMIVFYSQDDFLKKYNEFLSE